jgi:hypothetical protein
MKMATAVFAKTLEGLQQMSQLKPKTGNLRMKSMYYVFRFLISYEKPLHLSQV